VTRLPISGGEDNVASGFIGERLPCDRHGTIFVQATGGTLDTPWSTILIVLLCLEACSSGDDDDCGGG